MTLDKQKTYVFGITTMVLIVIAHFLEGIITGGFTLVTFTAMFMLAIGFAISAAVFSAVFAFLTKAREGLMTYALFAFMVLLAGRLIILWIIQPVFSALGFSL